MPGGGSGNSGAVPSAGDWEFKRPSWTWAAELPWRDGKVGVLPAHPPTLAQQNCSRGLGHSFPVRCPTQPHVGEALVSTLPTWFLWKPEQPGGGQPAGVGRACRQGLKIQKPQAAQPVVAGDVKEKCGQWALEQPLAQTLGSGNKNGPKYCRL